MDTAYQSAEWDRTANLIAVVINIVRGKGKRAIRPDEIHPYASRMRKQKRGSFKNADRFFRAVVEQRKKRKA